MAGHACILEANSKCPTRAHHVHAFQSDSAARLCDGALSICDIPTGIQKDVQKLGLISAVKILLIDDDGNGHGMAKEELISRFAPKHLDQCFPLELISPCLHLQSWLGADVAMISSPSSIIDTCEKAWETA